MKQKKILKNFKLPANLVSLLDKVSLKTGKTKTRLVEESLTSFFASKLAK